jgi:hypothetical protein
MRKKSVVYVMTWIIKEKPVAFVFWNNDPELLPVF